MRRVGYTRRVLLRQLALLGGGLGAAWWLRERYLFPTPTVEFADGASDSGWMALPDPAGLVELPARVGGIPIRVVVDSGAQFSAIDRRLAQRLGLKDSPIPLLAFGVSGAPALTHTVSLDLAIGPLQLRGMRAATLELLTLSGVIRRPFAMLIGRDVLRALAVDIDWPNGRARFVRPEAFQPPPGAAVAKTRSQGGALMTSVSIEGSAPIEVMVDTGATSDLALSQDTAQTLGLLADRRITTGRSVSLGGMSQDQVVRASAVEFAGRRLTDVEVQVFTPTAPAPLPAGLLGVG
ncbi:retroviral-like aspartic protease family protein, partial [Phenylobacterium sp.]|uniref:retroviral-like aspartic protease family protein n=1 Tax=Phenylobacterium sp. TaxID=1871053 RepID=UPI002DF636DA|nr:retroviral-like aspartic protease family protein [Phenylobacterium sp.]